jgi:phage shock protein E
MEWAIILVTAAAAVLLIRRLAFVSEKDACGYLKSGGVIVDVRSAAEFDGGHVARAINLPLATLPDAALSRFPDKDQVLLVHCLAGGRSAVAKRLLKSKGYTRVFNLGAYRRVERIVRRCQESR